MAAGMVQDVYVRVTYVTISFGVNGPNGAGGYTIIRLSELPAWMARQGVSPHCGSQDVVQVLAVVPV